MQEQSRCMVTAFSNETYKAKNWAKQVEMAFLLYCYIFPMKNLFFFF
jgi:hypothetical protein